MRTSSFLVFAAVAVAGAASAQDHPPTAAPFSLTQAALDSIRYAVRVADNNLTGVTITNYGFFGNNFVSRAPSLEYPLGTGNEHLVRGGLWIGAHAIDANGRFTGVTSAAIDGAQGSASQSATEFTPAGLEISVRSRLPNNRFYNPIAISEQDLISTFSDRPAKRANENNEDHRPMGLLVRQENYMWSFSDYAHIVFFHYVIRNDGPPLDSVWVGIYTEFASGQKNYYSVWPPSSSGSSVGGWYRKKWIAYDDTLRLLREHYCANSPMPAACNLDLVPYWIGVKLLGVSHGDIPDRKVTVAAWDYAPGSPLRDEDVERYALMGAGTIQDLNVPELQPPNDPAELISIGPFPQVDPGDSISVDFAIVGGAGLEDPGDIQRHAVFAQRAFDRDYIVPVPPPSPRFHTVARDESLDLYWDDSPESASDPTSPIPQDFEGYRVYIGEDRLDLKRIAQFDLANPPHDTTGFNTGLSAVRLTTPVVFDGVTYHYKYSVPALRNGFKYFCAVTAYDLGNTEIESLESGLSQNKTLAIPAPAAGERADRGVTVFPNPYRVEARWDQGRLVRDHYLWFLNLPERCAIRIFTLSGDLVYSTDFDGRTYHGGGARGVYDPRRELDVPPPTLSGRVFAWDLISREGQAVATGLYLYSVEDGVTHKRTVGKFLVVKSDREDF